MSKACLNEAEAQATVQYYAAKDGTEAFYELSGDKYLVFRKADHKVLKSINYSPADLEEILR